MGGQKLKKGLAGQHHPRMLPTNISNDWAHRNVDSLMNVKWPGGRNPFPMFFSALLSLLLEPGTYDCPLCP